MEPLDRRVADTAKTFRAVARERGLLLTADDRVSEADAAELVGYAVGSFRNLRSMGLAPAFFNRPLNGGRVSYRLQDLAEWIEVSREQTI